jgi:hypothetical protein
MPSRNARLADQRKGVASGFSRTISPRGWTNWRMAVTIAGGVCLSTAMPGGQSPLTPSAMRNHPAIGYQTVPPADAVAGLADRLRRGDAKLEFEPTTGYLRSVLDALHVPAESQLLVFSKSSFQQAKIDPRNPRALYFNDTVSVGWVRGGTVLEFAAQDPRQGTMFYTLEQTPSVAPVIRHDLSCVQCHTSDATLDVPGMFVGSSFTDTSGAVVYTPVFSVDHRTPFDLRWGGWYVTGRHALPRHMGNSLMTPGGTADDQVNPADLLVESLEGRFDTTGFLSPHSDIVALMMLEHQAHLLNLLTRIGWHARLGAAAGVSWQNEVNELVDYLLFVDEEPLPGAVRTSPFAKTFASQGPRDAKGRSLRDLDLDTRLLRYPCSFVIYSDPFDALPAEVKRAVYARMWDILSGRDRAARYARLSADDRLAIVEILRDTKADLPDYFTPEQDSTSP